MRPGGTNLLDPRELRRCSQAPYPYDAYPPCFCRAVRAAVTEIAGLDRPDLIGYDNALPKQGVSVDVRQDAGATFSIAGSYTSTSTDSGYTTLD